MRPGDNCSACSGSTTATTTPTCSASPRYEQLRHYAFHLAKLAGAAAQAADGDESDFLARRLPDLLLFGVKLATLTNEPLPDELVTP